MTSILTKSVPTLLIVLVSFVARNFSPVVYVFNSPHDDLLAVEQAGHILQGEWLGDWSNRTLSKPPGYAIFLVIAHKLSISPEWLLWGMVLLVSFYLSWVISNILNIQSHHKKTLIFAILVLNPVFYAADFSRLYRTSLYTILALIFTSLYLHLCLELINKNNQGPANVIVPKTIQLFFALGGTYGFMSITRTEGIWLFIPFIVTTIFILITKTKQLKGKAKTSKIMTIGTGLIVMLLASVIPSTLIASANLKHYGVETVENFYSGSFAEAMKNWESVIPDEKYPPNISITKSMREKVYKVSPAALSLKEYLEAAPNTGWKVFNCGLGYPCDESGSWIPWEIRDAAVTGLQINSESAFNDFFKQLNLQIQEGCRSKRIACRSPGIAPMLINIRYIS